jgi:hypothetical protein
MKKTPIRNLFRRGAVDTSVQAAESLPVNRLELLVLEAIRASKKNGMTADELLATFPNLSYSSVTARPAALKEKGFIVDSGNRRPSRTGRNQAVLVALEFAK